MQTDRSRASTQDDEGSTQQLYFGDSNNNSWTKELSKEQENIRREVKRFAISGGERGSTISCPISFPSLFLGCSSVVRWFLASAVAGESRDPSIEGKL